VEDASVFVPAQRGAVGPDAGTAGGKAVTVEVTRPVSAAAAEHVVGELDAAPVRIAALDEW